MCYQACCAADLLFRCRFSSFLLFPVDFNPAGVDPLSTYAQSTPRFGQAPPRNVVGHLRDGAWPYTEPAHLLGVHRAVQPRAVSGLLRGRFPDALEVRSLTKSHFIAAARQPHTHKPHFIHHPAVSPPTCQPEPVSIRPPLPSHALPSHSYPATHPATHHRATRHPPTIRWPFSHKSSRDDLEGPTDSS